MYHLLLVASTRILHAGHGQVTGLQYLTGVVLHLLVLVAAALVVRWLVATRGA